MSDTGVYESRGDSGGYDGDEAISASKAKTRLDRFFKDNPEGKAVLDRRIKNYLRISQTRKSEAGPSAEYTQALTKLDTLIKALTWKNLKEINDEQTLLAHVNNIMDTADTVCKTVLTLLTQGRLDEDDLKRFFECLAPWICEDTFIGASFWNRDGKNEKIGSQLLGGSHLMRRIVRFHKILGEVRSTGGSVLDLEANGVSCIDVASLTSIPSALSVAGRAGWAAKILVEILKEAEAAPSLNLLDVAAGDGPLAEAIVQEAREGAIPIEAVKLIDMDPAALQRAKTREALSAIIPDTVQVDLRTPGSIKSTGQRMIGSMGYGDYIEKDEDFVALLKEIIDSAPSGSIVGFGVFQTGHPHSFMLTLGLHWRLKTRTSEELEQIGKKAGLVDVKVHKMPIDGSTEKTCQLLLTGRTPAQATA